MRTTAAGIATTTIASRAAISTAVATISAAAAAVAGRARHPIAVDMTPAGLSLTARSLDVAQSVRVVVCRLRDRPPR